MPRVPPGVPHKPPGRKPGVPNKLTRDIRAQMQAFAEKRTPEELEKLWKKMVRENPGRALEVYVKLCEYFVPKLARHEVTGPGGEGPAIVERVEYRTALPAAMQTVEVGDVRGSEEAGSGDAAGNP